jgi:hypothetical protein
MSSMAGRIPVGVILGIILIIVGATMHNSAMVMIGIVVGVAGGTQTVLAIRKRRSGRA